MTDVVQAGDGVAPSRKAERAGGLAQKIRTGLFFLSVAIVLYLGWRQRGEAHLTAEFGIGYALGIAGAVMMALLLLYPMRKKLKPMRNWGRVAHWFRAHMILGVLGPASILFHANFKLGSLNSNVALFAMLLVVASGLVGRYIYAKTHHGLFGRMATLEELQGDTTALAHTQRSDLGASPGVFERLRVFETAALSSHRGLLASAWFLLVLGVKARVTRFRLSRAVSDELHRAARHNKWTSRERRDRIQAARRYVRRYLRSVRRAAEFGFYQRLFGYWHVLHLPLFAILALATVAHVVAVHLY